MSLATEYRPYTFSEVVGQETTVEALKNIAKADGVKVRSILLQGSYGSGKTTLARIFGKAMVCKKFKETGDVCKRGEECDACKEAQLYNSQSYMEFDSTRVGNVDQIRSMDMIFSAQGPYGRRVITIDEVHACSKQAQTALLKVIEEGIPGTILMFCTTDDVLPTIESRSIKFDITTLPYHLIAKRILDVSKYEGVMITESQANIIAQKSMGHMRNALSILEQFTLAGESALRTPLRQLKKLTLYLLQGKQSEDLIQEILLYPLVDIRSSISNMVRDYFVSQESFEIKIRQTNIHNKIFSFFYSTESQNAMNDEYGMDIVLHAYCDLFKRK